MVSIIIPCYNQAQYLSEALDSVITQTHKDWECIVVNDGSPDNTEEIAMQYCEKDKRIKYFAKLNGGHSAARNFGIRHSKGEYILPLDGDDKISEIFLEKAVEVLHYNRDVKVVSCQVQLFGYTNEKWVQSPYDFKSLLLVNSLCITCLFRREDYDQTMGYDETMLGFEDWDFWISMLKKGGKVFELPYTCFYYRKKIYSTFQDFLKDKKRVSKDLLKLYNNQIEVYQQYFPSPIELIRENEKLNRVINAYHLSVTYKLGTRFQQFKKMLFRSK